jgi:hypothetical protein
VSPGGTGGARQAGTSGATLGSGTANGSATPSWRHVWHCLSYRGPYPYSSRCPTVPAGPPAPPQPSARDPATRGPRSRGAWQERSEGRQRSVPTGCGRGRPHGGTGCAPQAGRRCAAVDSGRRAAHLLSTSTPHGCSTGRPKRSYTWWHKLAVLLSSLGLACEATGEGADKPRTSVTRGGALGRKSRARHKATSCAAVSSGHTPAHLYRLGLFERLFLPRAPPLVNLVSRGPTVSLFHRRVKGLNPAGRAPR